MSRIANAQIAAGNGNVTLAAARRFCDVTSTDYVPALLARGKERAAAEADVFPVDAQITALEPSSAAFDMAMVMPRSLKDPVGFDPSHLR